MKSLKTNTSIMPISTASQAYLLALLSPAVFFIFSSLCFASEAIPDYSKKLYEVPEVKVATGKALAFSSDGSLAGLWAEPFNLIIWQKDFSTYNRTDRTEDVIDSPADIDFWGPLTLFLCDDWNGGIFQYNRRLKMVNKLQYSSEAGFEPVSICLDVRGRVFAINQVDSNIWTLDTRHVGSRKNIAQSVNSTLRNPRKIHYDSRKDQLIVLEEHSVAFCQTNGNVLRRIPSEVIEPRAMANDSSAIWVMGDGLERQPLKLGEKRLLFSTDDLKSWGIYPVAAIAVGENGKVFLLAETGGRLLELTFPQDAFRSK